MASFDLTNSMTSGAVYFGNYRDPNDRNSVLGRAGGGGSNIEYEEMGVILWSTTREKFSSIVRTITDTFVPRNFSISELSNNTPGYLTGRRPSTGQQYPRGYYNK